jgi:hypothetical protein
MQAKAVAGTAIFALFVSLTISGCAGPSQPTRFYRLDGQLEKTQAISLKPGSGQSLIGIGPITLADYLDRPQIIERQTPHRLRLHEFDHWAGSLKQNIVQVLTDLTRSRLDGMQVVGYPWPAGLRPDYEVALNVSRFEREADRIWLGLSWSLVRTRDRSLLEMQHLVLEEPIDGDGIEAGVAAANRAMGQLAQRIAAVVMAVQRP